MPTSQTPQQPFSGQSTVKTSTSARNRKWSAWLMSVGGILLFALFISKISITEFQQLLKQADLRLLAISFLLGAIVTVLRAIRFSYYFKSNGQILLLYGVFALLRMLNYVLPFRSGEFASLAVLKKTSISPTIVEAAPVWAALRMIDLAILATLFIGALVLERVFLENHPMLGYLTLLILIASIFFMLITPAMSRWIHSASWINKRFPKFRQHMDNFSLGLTRLSKKNLVVGVRFSLYIWILNLVSGVIIIIAFIPDANPLSIFLATTIATALSALPIRTPLGIGTGDAMWIVAFSLIGLTLEIAISLALAIRILQMALVAFDGAIGLLITVPRRY